MHYLDNLRSHYSDMKARGEYASVFDVKHNRKTFRVLFLADNLGKILFISSVGENSFTFLVVIPSDFHAPKFYIGEEYGSLLEYLMIDGRSEHKLIPQEFLIEIEQGFPARFEKAPSMSERISTANRYYCNEPPKYFSSWITWHKRHTTEENMLRTATLVGFENALRLQRSNISSKWSHNPDDEKLENINKWVTMIDN